MANVSKHTVLHDFLGTVKAAPHECVISTGQPLTKVKVESNCIILHHYLSIDEKHII